MQTVGFIGLGIMGKPMVKNLLKAGYPVRAFDIMEGAVQEVGEAGAVPCTCIAEAAEGCGIVITMLPNSPHVRQVVLGEGGLLSCAAPGTLVVDMSSISPDASREMHAALAEKGVHMLDAPVSGGEPKAVDGTLAIMVGGAAEDFERAKPLFDVLGASAVLVGDIGSGNTCKLVNQVIVAANIAALAEGMMLAKRSGTDPRRVFEAIRGGLAGSTVMDAKAPMMLEGNFQPGFRIGLHIKDLANALEAGASSGTPLLLTAEVMQMMQVLRADGQDGSDHSALALFYEKLAGTSLTEEAKV